MVMIISGKNHKGEDCEMSIDGYLHETLSGVKKVVSKKDFDYVTIISGDPGLGKSNFAINCCKTLDPNFTINNIAMTAEEFIEITTKIPKHSAVMLDESFASLNSRVGRSADFLRILNHLQIIRQRNLFIFLCLPNYFDLQKSISIYRSRHLFVVFGKEFGSRGRFIAFGKNEKKELYIKGLKFMNYNAVKANYYGSFTRQKAIDEKEYEKKKYNHLMDQNKKLSEHRSLVYVERNKSIILNRELGASVKLISEKLDISERRIYQIIKGEKDREKIKEELVIRTPTPL